MRTITVIATLVLVGCGGNDEYVPTDAPQAVDAVDAVVVDAGLDAAPIEANEGYQGLQRLQAAAIAYHNANMRYPAGEAPITPNTACCAQTGMRCAPVASDWATPVWQAYDFAITEPFQYQYYVAVSANGRELTAIATGDLDCDGTASELMLTCTTTATGTGTPECVITTPQLID